MSSLIRCTDDLLQQRAVQSSHYERLERQLVDRERRRRAVVMTLQQRIADVERRGNDVVDLRNERQQLTQQLAHHALQLAALQYRAKAAQKMRLAAMERLHDGVRGWSGHPAAIVLVVRALQAQKTLRTAGCSLARVLRRVLSALGLHQHLRAFRVRCAAVRQWHKALHTTLTAQLKVRTQRASGVRDAALKEAAEANAEVEGPLRMACNTAQQEKLLLEARHNALAIYGAALQERCDVAQREVLVLTAGVDAGAGEVTAWEGRWEEATAVLAEATAAWTAQRDAFAALRASAAEEQRRREAATAEAAGSLALVQASVRCTADRKAGAEQRVQLLRRQALVVGLVVDLCATQRRRRAQRRAAETSDRSAVEAELMQLRAAHAEHLRARQAARMAAHLRTAADALLRLEGQRRKAAVELEEDEWRLLHAQLVRDACRARATETAAAEEKRRSARETAEKAVASSVATTETRAGGKRARGAPPPTTASARRSAAARRQRLALESVDRVTLTASQGGRTHPVTPTVAPTATATRPSRAACRLVSLRPSVAKLAVAGADATSSAAAAATAAASATTPPLKQAKHAHAATVAAMSPFMAAVSASDSSFSLMPDSAHTDTGAAAFAAGRRSTREDAMLLSTVRVSSTSSASSLLTSPLSPSPRCPAGGDRRVVRPVNVRHAATAATAAAAATLPRRGLPFVQKGEMVRVGGGAEGAGSVSDRSTAPRSALDSALMAARTPRPAALGDATAIPAAGAGAAGAAGGGGGGVGVVRVVSLFPPRSSVGEAGRRRAPPLVAADDLFADLFS